MPQDTQATNVAEMSKEELLAHIATLEKRVTSREPYMQVSDKGAISFYNVQGRFPITAYKMALLHILTLCTGYSAEEIEASDMPIAHFLTEHNEKLSTGPVRDTSKVQNTVVSARDNALRTVFDAIKKANPKMSVAEAEAEAKRQLGWK